MKLFIFIFILAACFAVNAQQHINVGDAAPEFSAESLQGNTFDSSELRGKVVLLTFWSTKCQICHEEMPKMNALVAKYGDKDVVFLGSTLEQAPRLEPYLKKNKVSFNILTNGFGLMLKYADLSKNGDINMLFPSYFLIDKTGKVAERADGWDKTERIDAKIKELIAN